MCSSDLEWMSESLNGEEAVERLEKLCGVVSQRGKSKPHFLYRVDGERETVEVSYTNT